MKSRPKLLILFVSTSFLTYKWCTGHDSFLSLSHDDDLHPSFPRQTSSLQHTLSMEYKTREDNLERNCHQQRELFMHKRSTKIIDLLIWFFVFDSASLLSFNKFHAFFNRRLTRNEMYTACHVQFVDVDDVKFKYIWDPRKNHVHILLSRSRQTFKTSIISCTVLVLYLVMVQDLNTHLNMTGKHTFKHETDVMGLRSGSCSQSLKCLS